MGTKLNDISLAEVSFGIIVIAAIGNSFILTLSEGIRLFFIFLGMVFLYRKYGRRISINDPHSAVYRYGVSLLGFVLMFLLIQFDPVFARIDIVSPQESMNWFFILSSTAAFAGFAASLRGRYLTASGSNVRQRLLSIWHSWILLDRVVLAVISAITLFLLLIGAIFPEAIDATRKSGIGKLGMCLLLYIAVLGFYRLSDTEEIQSSFRRTARSLKAACTGLLVAFFVMTVLVAYNVISAFYDQRQGIALVEAGDYDKAVILLEEAFSKFHDYSEPLNVPLGKAFLGLGKSEEAEKQFNFARRATPNSQTVEKRIGDAYSSMGIWDKAITAYKSAHQANPDPWFVFSPLCLAYLKSGERLRVIELIRESKRIPRLDLNSVEELAEFGIILTHTGHYAEAQEYMDRALRLNPASAVALYARGLLENRRKNWDKAKAFLEKSLSLDTFTNANYELGVAYRNLNQADEATVEFQKVLAAEPGNIPALGHLVNLFRSAGKDKLAEDMIGRMKLFIEPSGWKGPFGRMLVWSGTSWYEMELFKGVIEIKIYASGTPASDIWPQMSISLDDQRVGFASVDRADMYVFKADVESTGFHKLAVSFLNDSTRDDVGDRNLFIDQAEIRYLEVH